MLLTIASFFAVLVVLVLAHEIGHYATARLFKVGIEALATPLTYRLVRLLKKVEEEDYYDTDTDFNPFKLGAS